MRPKNLFETGPSYSALIETYEEKIVFKNHRTKRDRGERERPSNRIKVSNMIFDSNLLFGENQLPSNSFQDIRTLSTNSTSTLRYSNQLMKRKTKISLTISEECFDINSLMLIIESGIDLIMFQFTARNFKL